MSEELRRRQGGACKARAAHESLINRCPRGPRAPINPKGVSIGALGYATSFEHLVASRMVQGVCVAGLTAAASLSMLDLATPLNRARTLAPVAVAYSAGIAAGPVLGGLLMEAVGIRSTFVAVGGLYGALMLCNHVLIAETAPKLRSGRLWDELCETAAQWKPIIERRSVRDVYCFNGTYFRVCSGRWNIARDTPGAGGTQCGVSRGFWIDDPSLALH